jgi:hypothetical protein
MCMKVHERCLTTKSNAIKEDISIFCHNIQVINVPRQSSSYISSVRPPIQGRQFNGLFRKIEEFLCDFHRRSYTLYVYL